MNWYEYQELVADVFRNIGAEVKTNYKAVGARGVHDLDVWIKLKKYSIEMTWICECKFWKDSIPKEKVITLYGITKDLGVDRGFLFFYNEPPRSKLRGIKWNLQAKIFISAPRCGVLNHIFK